MENINLLFSLIGTAVSFFITVIIIIIKFVKNVRSKKKIENSAILMDAVAPLMTLAEKFKNFSGEEKREYVLTNLNRFSIENGIEFNSAAITAKIEELIKLTKEVNTNKN